MFHIETNKAWFLLSVGVLTCAMCDISTFICSTRWVGWGTTSQRRRRSRGLEKEAATGGETQQGWWDISCIYVSVYVCRLMQIYGYEYVSYVYRSNLVWGSSFWRKRGRKSRSGSDMLAASLLIATTPNKETAIQVRAGLRTAHFAFDLLKCRKVLINANLPHLAIENKFKNCLCFRTDFSNQNQFLARL